MKLPFVTVGLNRSNISFGASFFLIYLDLKLTCESILLKKYDCFYLKEASFTKVMLIVKMFPSQY